MFAGSRERPASWALPLVCCLSGTCEALISRCRWQTSSAVSLLKTSELSLSDQPVTHGSGFAGWRCGDVIVGRPKGR